MSANTKFVRGGTSGINGTVLKDGQILFDKDKKVISLDIKVNNQLVRIEMDGPIMEGATSLADGETGTVPQPLIGDRDKYLKGDGTWATPTNTTTGDGLKMKVAKTGTTQSSITNTLAANTTMDNAIGALLNNDATIANQKLGDFVSVSDVTVDSVTYHTYWIVAPTSSNQVYGIAIHPTNGRLYRIYNNKGTYSVTAYDANDNTKVAQTATSTNSAYEVLFSNSANNTTETAGARKDSGLTFNPSTDTLATKVIDAKVTKALIGSGTAGSDAGSGVSPRYTPSLWTFDAGVTVADGEVYFIKIPVAGGTYGVWMSLDNGTNYYPVAVGASTGRFTTQYPVNTVIAITYESASVCECYARTGADATDNVTGCFRVLNDYDSGNSDTKVTQTASTGNSNYEVLFSNTADNTTRTEATRKNSNLKFNPSTGNLQTTQLNGVNVGSSPAFTDTRDFKLGTTRNGATNNTLYFIYST